MLQTVAAIICCFLKTDAAWPGTPAAAAPPSPPPPGPAPPSPPGPLPAGCYVDDAHGPVQFKYSPGNLFPNEPHHGVKLTDSPAQCCALCQSFTNCTFWNYEYGGTSAQPNCYGVPGGCCFLKTDAAWPGTPGPPGVVSGSTKPLPAPPSPPPPTPIAVGVDWAAAPLVVASTAATVEIDCCEPFLTRDPRAHTNGGGPFSSYFHAMKQLGTEFVRFAPWYPYPRIVVTELEPSDCTSTKPATNWNSSLFDPILADFMLAVCGEDAVHGKCNHSVAQQISTMPSWMYVGGADPASVPADPWDSRMSGYNSGTVLKDETCSEMASYIARWVAHYTAGGHTDTCGHHHPSGFNYNWTIVSVLNENEHKTGGVRYTRCFDAVRVAVEKVNPTITLEGPESVFSGDGDYSHYFIDPKNHADGRAPDIVSNHAYWVAGSGPYGDGAGYESFYTGVDHLVTTLIDPLVAVRDTVAPKTELVLNEWIPSLTDWCNETDATALFAKHKHNLTHPLLTSPPPKGRAGAEGGICPDWRDPRSAKIGINRATLGWSAAAGQFAYGVGQLALHGKYKYVGNDDLACGVWPDNEPSVTGLDWQTGEWNAKTWVTKMLVEALGAGPKAFLPATLTFTNTSDSEGPNATLYAMPYVLQNGAKSRGIMLVIKRHLPQVAVLQDITLPTTALVLEGVGPEPGFNPPKERSVGADGRLELGPFAVVMVRV